MCQLSLILGNIYGVKWSVTNQRQQLTGVYGFALSYMKQNINLLYNYFLQNGFLLVGGVFKIFIFMDFTTFP